MMPNRTQEAAALLVALVVVVTVFPAAAQDAKPFHSAVTEYRAEQFGTDEQEATRKLNELASQGWRYVGPLGSGLVAFQRKRPMSGPLAADAELKKLQGEWVYISREDDGKVTEYEDWVLSVSGTRWQEQYKGRVAFDRRVVIVDIAHGPKGLTLHTTRDLPGGPATGFAIYKIEDDTLTYCMFLVSDDALLGGEARFGPLDEPGQTYRPKTFDTKGKRGRVTFTLKRSKQ